MPDRCSDCPHFKSFRDIYDDPNEDSSMGVCYLHPNHPLTVQANGKCRKAWAWEPSDK